MEDDTREADDQQRGHGAADGPDYASFERQLKKLFEALPKDAEELLRAEDVFAQADRVIDDYRIVRLLGAGGMARVFEAEQLSLSRRVALKVLPAIMSLSERAVQTFHEEALALGRQHHPGIVTIFSVGEYDGQHYIAQELVGDGRTLAHELEDWRAKGGYPASHLPRLVGWIADVAEAVEHAHASGVVHRDIKPSNILLPGEGGPKVSDFGLAKIGKVHDAPETGEFVGTPFYVAPEQSTGDRSAADHRADVFSLGVTLYECLTLKRPFGGETTVEVVRQIQTADAVDPREIDERIPQNLAAICRKAMQKDPAQRYQTMGAFAADLRRALAGEPVEASRQDTSGVPVWRREPYRVFFPLGVLLAWAGLFHWIAFALEWGTYRGVFHSIAQIQGFMMCFGVGFLMTAIPRRTGTAPPAAWQMVVAMVCPVATTVAAWFGQFAASQMPWLVLVVVLIGFAVSRFRAKTASRRPPTSFVWIPLSFLMAFVGIVLMSLYGALGLEFAWHHLGKLLILQGLFLGLVLGIGGMVLPLITCGDAPPDGGPNDLPVRAWHVTGALGLAGTFVLEVFGDAQLAYALRGAIVLAVLLLQSRIWRVPQKPGLHRRLVWLSAWMIPIGFALAAALYPNFHPGLHTVFIGGFGLMALSVGLHVTFAHGGRPDLVHGTAWQTVAMGVCILAAVVLRALVNLGDPADLALWMGLSSAVFLVGTLFWFAVAIAPLRGAR